MTAISSEWEDGSTRVLHIRRYSELNSHASPMSKVDERLAGYGISVAHCPDVYRGLAQIGNAKGECLCAVLVCVDGIAGPEEMEFFALVNRARRDLPVYVYSDGAGDAAVNEALGRGATASLGEAVLEQLVRRPPMYRAESRNPTPPGRGQGVGRSVPCDPPPPMEFERAEPMDAEHVVSETEEIDDEPSEHATEITTEERELSFEAEEPSSTRVPWLRYEGAPLRRKPPASPAPVSRSPGRSPVPEPLLTPEEIRALLEDDGELSDGGKPESEIAEPRTLEDRP